MSNHRNSSPRDSGLKNNSELRPIGARCLKSAIDSLRPSLHSGMRALDLYCGTGRFGESLLKEGIEHVTFVDKNLHFKQVGRLRKIYPNEARLITGDAFSFLKNSALVQEKFDLVFADPPFPCWTETFSKELCLLVKSVLEKDAIFLVKYPSRVIPCLANYGFRELKTTQFGESRLIYLTSIF